MLNVRLGAGLVLGAVALAAAVPAAAGANTYCAGAVPQFYGCDASSPTIQGALDAAGSNPGYDLVRIVDGRHVLAAGLVYSDQGQADNEIWIGSGAGHCTKSLCEPVTLAERPARRSSPLAAGAARRSPSRGWASSRPPG